MGERSHMIFLRVPGAARGQARPRAGRGRVYAPKTNRDHTARILAAWTGAGEPILIDGPYLLLVRSFRRRSAGHYLTNGELSAAGRRLPYPGKPDIDNEVKAILDSLRSAGAIPDDRHLIHLTAQKEWLENPSDNECVDITLRSMTPIITTSEGTPDGE